MTLAVSTGRADITPRFMREMGGYGTKDGPRLADGTYSALWARATVIWDGANPAVIVTLDVGTIPPAWHDALRPRLVELAPWASASIAVVCTHTHNGPMTLSHPDPWITYAATPSAACEEYWLDLAGLVVGLVDDTLNAPRTPVTVEYQWTLQNWSAPRVSPTTYTETAVPQIRFLDAAGQPRAVLFSYGTHPVTAGVQTRWDGDYPAAACSVIEAGIPGCHAQFILGPAGDQDPLGTRGWRLRDTLGTQLGAAVVNSISTTPGRVLAGPLSASLTSVAVPLHVPATPADRAARVAEYQSRIIAPPAPNPWAAEPWTPRHAAVAIAQINAGTDPHSIDVPIQVWRLPGTQGAPPLRILLVGGEPVSGYGMWARNLYGGVNGMFVGGYANVVNCYVVGNPQLPPPEGLDGNGGYEGGHHSWANQIAWGSMSVYNLPWRFKAGLTPYGAEMTIRNAIAAALA